MPQFAYLALCLSLFLIGSPDSLAQTSDWDEDTVPIMRFGPDIPDELYESGYCCLIFGVDEMGAPKDIRADYCTSSKFEPISRETVSGWTYKPARKAGQPVYRPGVKTKIAIDLTYRDNLFWPGADGYLAPRRPYSEIPAPPSDQAARRDWMERYYFADKPCGFAIS